MSTNTIAARSAAPTIVTDAYVSERQRFVFVFLPGVEEPRRFRHVDDALTAINQEGFSSADLETESWSCQLYILEAKTEPARHALRFRTTLPAKESPTHG